MNLNKPTLNNRLIAILIDLLVFAATFYVLAYFILQPILHATPTFKQHDETIQTVMVDSGLFSVQNDNIVATQFKTSKEYEIFFRDFFERYNSPISIDEAFVEFPDYFTCKDGVCTPIDDETKMVAFYEDIFFQVASNLLFSVEEYRVANEYVEMITNIQIFGSMGISAVTFFFVIPLIFKDGKTLGMRVMKIAIVNSGTGYRAKKTQIILRQLILLGVEAGLSIFMLGVPAIISLGMLVFSKNNVTLHDYFAVTMMVNNKEYDVFSSQEECENAMMN